MEAVFAFVQSYQGLISLAVQVVLLVGIALLLHRTNATKRRLDEISKLVSDYVAAVMEEDVLKEESPETIGTKEEGAGKNTQELQQIQKLRKEEKENRLISAVLQEIFP